MLHYNNNNNKKTKESIRNKDGTHTIFCVICGEPRCVLSSNFRQVTRCYKHQYQEKRRYNSKYQKAKRVAKRIIIERREYEIPEFDD